MLALGIHCGSKVTDSSIFQVKKAKQSWIMYAKWWKGLTECKIKTGNYTPVFRTR